MMITCVSAPALPDLRPGRRLDGPAGPVNGVQGHRAARAAARGCRAAARGCRAAPHPSPAAPGLGRPRGPRHADPRPAPEPADTPAGHPGYRASLAPPPRHPEVDLSAPDGTAAGQRRGRRADRAARPRESRQGVPAGPGRVAQARLPGQRVYDPPSPQGTAYSPAPERHTDTTWRQFLHTQAATMPAADF